CTVTVDQGGDQAPVHPSGDRDVEGFVREAGLGRVPDPEAAKVVAVPVQPSAAETVGELVRIIVLKGLHGRSQQVLAVMSCSRTNPSEGGRGRATTTTLAAWLDLAPACWPHNLMPNSRLPIEN